MFLIIKYTDEDSRAHTRKIEVDKIVNSKEHFPSSAKGLLKKYPGAEVYIQMELNL